MIKPIFIGAHRSRSTILVEMCRPYLKEIGLISVSETEFFNVYSSVVKHVRGDIVNAVQNIPFIHKDGMKMHYVSPPMFSSFIDTVEFKLYTLAQDKDAGREYIVKVMSDTVTDSIIDFYSDRKFVFTRRNDLKGLFLSLLYGHVSNVWHKRPSNSDKYDDMKKTPVHVSENSMHTAMVNLIECAMLDKTIEHVDSLGYDYVVFDYEDLKTQEQRESALDIVFDGDHWRREYNPNNPVSNDVDYTKVFENYDEVLRFWDINGIEKPEQIGSDKMQILYDRSMACKTCEHADLFKACTLNREMKQSGCPIGKWR